MAENVYNIFAKILFGCNKNKTNKKSNHLTYRSSIKFGNRRYKKISKNKKNKKNILLQ